MGELLSFVFRMLDRLQIRISALRVHYSRRVTVNSV